MVGVGLAKFSTKIILTEIPTGVQMAAGAENVRQSMKILFLTEPGERIMREDYGCGLNDYLFANINDELIGNSNPN